MEALRAPQRVCSRIGFALFAMHAVWIICVLVLDVVLELLLPGFSTHPWGMWIVNDLPLYAVGLPIFLAVLRTIPDGPVWPRVRVPLQASSFLLAFAFSLGATYLCNFASGGILMLLEALGLEGIGGNGLAGLETAGNELPTLLFGAIVPALGEEYIFRYQLRRKLRGAPDSVYIFFSALCFSAFHSDFTQMPYCFVLGVLFAWLYLLTGKLAVPISLHFLFNLFGLIVMPTIAETPFGEMLVTVLVYFFIAVAVILFIRYLRFFRQTLRPPAEPWWPWGHPPRVPAARPGERPPARPKSLARLCLVNPGMLAFLAGALILMVCMMLGTMLLAG